MEYGNVSPGQNGLNIEIHGDGLNFKVNLNKPPFNLNFQGNLPSSMLVSGADQDITGSVTTEEAGDMLALIFSEAPGTDGIGLTITFFYQSLV